MESKQFLEKALGDNMNIQTLTPLAFAEIMDDYASTKIKECLNISNGCKDYGGGYRGNEEHFEIFQHGIQTVINSLNAYSKRGLNDTQVLALNRIGG